MSASCAQAHSQNTHAITHGQGLGLVFVAVYQKALSLMYVDELLAAVKAEFTANHYKPNVCMRPHVCVCVCVCVRRHAC